MHSNHRGQWVVLDARMQTIAIGDSPYGGQSPRSVLDRVSKRFLLPAMHRAAETATPTDSVVTENGETWRILAEPITGAYTGTPAAVIGVYIAPDDPLPTRPIIGSWEWRVTTPGPHQEMRTYWNRGLFDVYGIAPTNEEKVEQLGRQWQFWEGPSWLDELIAEEDRFEMQRMLNTFIHNDSDHLYFLTYHIKSQGNRFLLRLAGRAYRDSQPWIFRGISMRINNTNAIENSGPSADITAAFRLSRDTLLIVDTDYEHIYVTSPGVNKLNIALPPHRHLPKMVHPEDLSILRALFQQAIHEPSATAPTTIRFKGISDNWISLELVAHVITTPATSETPTTVMIRACPA